MRWQRTYIPPIQCRYLPVARFDWNSANRWRHITDSQVRDRETVRLAGIDVDEVTLPEQTAATVRWAARAIMQVSQRAKYGAFSRRHRLRRSRDADSIGGGGGGRRVRTRARSRCGGTGRRWLGSASWAVRARSSLGPSWRRFAGGRPCRQPPIAPYYSLLFLFPRTPCPLPLPRTSFSISVGGPKRDPFACRVPLALIRFHLAQSLGSSGALRE